MWKPKRKTAHKTQHLQRRAAAETKAIRERSATSLAFYRKLSPQEQEEYLESIRRYSLKLQTDFFTSTPLFNFLEEIYTAH